MLLAPHILIGAAIASKAGSPYLGIILAFLSHYIIDAIPHSEYSIESIAKAKVSLSALREFSVAMLDATLGLILVYFLASTTGENTMWMLLTGFVAILPDAIWPSRYFVSLKIFKILNIGHMLSRARHKKPPLFIGVATQIILSFLAIVVILF